MKTHPTLEPKYKFTAYGRFMYNLCANGAIFLQKHRTLYKILGYTWGILLTLFGLLCSPIFLLSGHPAISFHEIYYFATKSSNWGGLETGMSFIVEADDYDNSIKAHELGHTFQNAILGPFVLFLSFFPSVIRYWLTTFETQKGKIIYSTLIAFFSTLIGALLIIGLGRFSIAWIIIGVIILVYGLAISFWLSIFEIPRYAGDRYVAYDNIWFEASATDIGTYVVNQDNDITIKM